MVVLANKILINKVNRDFLFYFLSNIQNYVTITNLSDNTTTSSIRSNKKPTTTTTKTTSTTTTTTSSDQIAANKKTTTSIVIPKKAYDFDKFALETIPSSPPSTSTIEETKRSNSISKPSSTELSSNEIKNQQAILNFNLDPLSIEESDSSDTRELRLQQQHQDIYKTNVEFGSNFIQK
jgi:hypothetical protein